MYLVTDSERIATSNETVGTAPELDGIAAPLAEMAAAPSAVSTAPAPTTRRVPMHDDRWLGAFREQATQSLQRRMERFARHMGRLLEYCGGRGDAVYAEELVADVFTDTMLGTLAWDPTKNIKLSSHMLLAIRSRIRHECERAATLPHVSMDELDEALLAEVEDVLAEATPASNPEAVRLSTWIVERLRKLAAGDRDVLALLEGMCAGLLERGPLMQATGMSARTYDAARKRLDLLVARLPQHVV